MKLHQRSEYKNLTPRPSDDDYRSMKEDIKEHGQRLPITVNKDGIILDGYTRLQICEELGKKVKHAVVPTKAPEIERDLILSMNLKRRHLNTIQKIKLIIPFYKEEQKEAQKRMKKGTVAEISARGRSAKKAAKMIGVSESTFERGMYVIEKAPKDIQKKLDTSSMAINTAYGLLTRKERNLPKTPPPKGEFDVFLCDIPIGYKDKGGRGAALNHFDVMTPEELMELKLHTADNAVMFFWIPPSIQYDEIQITYAHEGETGTPIYKAILDSWDFRVKAEFVWNKKKIGRGSYNRYQHENLLVAIKGKMPIPAKLYSSIIEATRGKFSEKPDIQYEMIEKMYPKRKYVELFARKKRKGWTSHGNELKDKKIQVCKICGDNKEIPKEKQEDHIKKNHGKTTGNVSKFFTQITK